MITEKPSIAYRISKILSNNRYNKYSNEKMKVYTFRRLFKRKNSYFTVTSVKGHIYTNEYNEIYSDDEIEETYKFDINKKVNDGLENIPGFLKCIAKNKDILCLWIDCDPEGENICYEILHNVLPNMNKKKYQQVFRAKFSSLVDIDIKRAFLNLEDYPNCKLSMSIDARSIIDFKVGISFSNLFTLEILKYIDKENEVKKDLDVLSYGPCQTPTLWFCVKRKKEIDNFIPSKYYQIYIRIIAQNYEFQKVYMDKKYKNYKIANDVIDNLKSHLYAIVDIIKTRKKKIDSPEGLKTTTMLKIASCEMNESPKNISNYAQKLYMEGYISYPRTGATKYPPNFDFENHLKMFLKNPVFEKQVQKLLKDFKKDNLFFSKGEEKGGHEPIYPKKI
jgi:DNA topoisomerase-3